MTDGRPMSRRTVYEYAALYGSLGLLALICLSCSLLALPLYVLLPAASGTALGRHGIMLALRAYAWSLRVSGAYRLDLRALDVLREGPPLILAPNHPSLIDALLILTRHPNVACVVKSRLRQNLLLGPGLRLARYVGNDSPRRMIRESVAHLRRGCLLLLFPEGTRTTQPPINSLTASTGLIAKLANVPVQTVLIETDSPFLGKGWPLLRPPHLPITYRVRLGRRFEAPENAAAFTAQLDRYYRDTLGGDTRDRSDPRGDGLGRSGTRRRAPQHRWPARR